MRKALESGMLQEFEQKRSKCAKGLTSKELARRLQYANRACAKPRSRMPSGAISTVWGGR